jgi:type IV pilus assembly protein PilW
MTAWLTRSFQCCFYLQTRAHFRREGFTLLEVLLGVVLTAVLLAGIYNVFKSQEQGQIVVDQVAEMNQDLRVGTQWITRDMRMAGYHVENATATSGIGPLNSVTITPGAGSNPDGITIIYVEGDFNATITSPMPAPSSILNVNATCPGPGTPEACPGSTNCFCQNDIILITDGANSSVFCVTQVVLASLNLQHNPGGGPCDAYNDPGGHGLFPGYGTGSRLFKLKIRQYRIDADPADGHPRLSLSENGGNFNPVVDYIEDLQVNPTTPNAQLYTVTITARSRKPLTGLGGVRRRSTTQQVRMRNIN